MKGGGCEARRSRAEFVGALRDARPADAGATYFKESA